MSDFEDKLQSVLGNPDAMSQIMSIAKALSGEGKNEEKSPPPPMPRQEPPSPPSVTYEESSPFSLLGDLDPRMLQIGMRLFSEYNGGGGDDKRVALLAALRPFVKSERYETVDRAVQIAKLSRVIRVALEVFKGGGEDV